MRRTQIYLDEDQYRWLKQQAGEDGSISSVLGDLIDRARNEPETNSHDDPLNRHLLRDPPVRGKKRTTATSVDKDLYR